MNNPTIRLLGVGGTWARRHEPTAPQWYQKGHALYWFLLQRGFAWIAGHDGRCYEWTTRLAGHQLWRRFIGFVTRKKWAPSLLDWEVAGANLFAYVNPPLVAPEHWLPGSETHPILHSHAGNVGFFACAEGMCANVFVTVCTPARADMVSVIKRARPRIAHWIEIHSDASDLVQIAGEAGDGDLCIVRSFNDLRDPETGKTLRELGLGPNQTIVVDDGHSNILNDLRGFDRLQPILNEIARRHGRPDYLTHAS